MKPSLIASYRCGFSVSAEFVAAMKEVGYDNLSVNQRGEWNTRSGGVVTEMKSLGLRAVG